MFAPRSGNEEHALGYLELRTWIGVLGMALPFILAIGGSLRGSGLEPSLSAYYHTSMQVAFVGTLWVIAFFLLSYRGFKYDWLFGDLAAVFAIGITVFPTDEVCMPGSQYDLFHKASAISFFVILIIFSGFLFTQSNKTAEELAGTRKQKRNWIYRGCAFIMAGALLAVVLSDEPSPCNPNYTLVFWMESVAIFFFGISWFVKGGNFLADSKPDPAQ